MPSVRSSGLVQAPVAATGVVHEPQAGVGDGARPRASNRPCERASPTTTATDTAYAGIS